MSTIIDKVETFIQRVHDLEYIVTSEATNLWYVSKNKLYPMPNDKTNLSDSLASAMAHYQENKDDEKERLHYAQICFMWINRAFTSGVIREGKGLITKFAECKRRNEMLERDLEVLSEQYLRLQEKYEPLMRRFTPIPEDTNQEDEK
jgi:hypothetical protein